jgi:hypothetical protein
LGLRRSRRWNDEGDQGDFLPNEAFHGDHLIIWVGHDDQYATHDNTWMH